MEYVIPVAIGVFLGLCLKECLDVTAHYLATLYYSWRLMKGKRK